MYAKRQRLDNSFSYNQVLQEIQQQFQDLSLRLISLLNGPFQRVLISLLNGLFQRVYISVLNGPFKRILISLLNGPLQIVSSHLQI